MRYAIYGKCTDGTMQNVFKDDRSFKNKSWARTILDRMQNTYKEDFFIKEVSDEITDTSRLEWMIDRGEVWEVVGGYSTYIGEHTAAIFKTPREAIDAAMKESK